MPFAPQVDASTNSYHGPSGETKPKSERHAVAAIPDHQAVSTDNEPQSMASEARARCQIHDAADIRAGRDVMNALILDTVDAYSATRSAGSASDWPAPPFSSHPAVVQCAMTGIWPSILTLLRVAESACMYKGRCKSCIFWDRRSLHRVITSGEQCWFLEIGRAVSR